MAGITNILNPATRTWAIDFGLFLLRVGTGGLLIPHGWSKLQAFGEKSADFYDFLHLGPQFSMGLTIFSELICSALLVLGLGTRFVLIPLIITMLVVVFVIKEGQSLGDRESGLLYLVPFIVLFFTGPGRISLDQLFFGKKQTV